jgi:hypothetical protein
MLSGMFFSSGEEKKAETIDVLPILLYFWFGGKIKFLEQDPSVKFGKQG